MSTSTKTMAAAQTKNRTKIRVMAQVGMLSAIALVLMLFEIPLPFAPSFYEIILNFAVNGTMTAGVGEIANFLIGCAFVVPAGLIYKKKHNRTGAIVGMISGTLFMTILGCFLNAYVLLPAYAKAFQMPMDALVGMGTAVNSHITSVTTLVIFAIVPFNLLKGVLVSLIVFLIYKKISPIFHKGR